MEYANAEAHPTIATGESPGIAFGGKFTTHDQVQFILGIVRRVQVVFGAVAIAMKRFTDICSHADMPREAAGIDGDGSRQADTLSDMVPGGDAQHAPIFSDGLLDDMAHAQDGARGDGAAGKMRVEAAHVHNAGDGGVVAQQHFTLWRNKIYAGYWMVEMLGDGQRLHVTDPTTTTCMNGIAYFIVAL